MMLSRSRPILTSTPCLCIKQAHTTATSPLTNLNLPPTLISPEVQSSDQSNPHWSDPSYVARYRDPNKFSLNRKPKPSSSSTSSSSSSPIASTSNINSATREDYRRREKARETPRSNRLKMEKAWSGGDFSPPIPSEHYRLATNSSLSKHALLFPGSGSQYVGMGHFLKDYPAASKIWEEAEEALEGFEGWMNGLGLKDMEGDLGGLGRIMEDRKAIRMAQTSLKKVVFEGPQDELTRSSNAQPAILITSMAFLRTLENDFDSPIAQEASLFLGHSSGEYSAAVASGAVSFADGVRLTRLHGLLTSYALLLPNISLSASLDSPPASRAQMSALVINPGHSHSEVLQIIQSIKPLPGQTGAEGSVEVASYNSRAQVVLAGSRDGILRASEELTSRGIASRAADLPVSAPFHCGFMKPAGDGMKIALDKLTISAPTAPIVSGLDGALITSPTDLISNLVSQVALPVRWSDCLASLRTSDINRLIFLGPGKALANLARRDAKLAGEDKDVEVVSVATDEDLGMLRDLWEER